MIESNQIKQETQQRQFMEKMETLHHMEMIEFESKLNELREKIRVLEQQKHRGWWY
jgi:polyhydroxyalkanoate synthesis regulator phasin